MRKSAVLAAAVTPAAPEPATKPTWMFYTAGQRWGFLAILCLAYISNYYDRNVLSVLLEPIKREYHVSDALLGLLGGFCFAAFYAVFGIPIARWADRGNRRTIITLALSVWSAMTILCGLAQNFAQLALARVGVGSSEGGLVPPAQSLIADYFPPDRRASALAVFTTSSSAGYLLGLGAGGYIAATYGWRAAFLVAGAPGVLLALITRFGLAEPRMWRGFPGPTDVERLPDTVARLMAKRSFVHALAGSTLYFFLTYGALFFIPSFLIRVQHIPLATVSVAYGAVSGVSSLLGAVGGGWLADRLSRHDVRWLAWLPAAACTLSGPLYVAAFACDDLASFLVLAFFAGLLLSGGLPPVLSAIHAVCGHRRRAMAIAILYFIATLIGGGFGPLVTGAASDMFTVAYGQNGLRYALMLVVSLLVATGAFFYRFGRTMSPDLED